MSTEGMIHGCDHDSEDSPCPFDYTEVSAEAQNSGSIPCSIEATNMLFHHGKLMACLEDPTVPCSGVMRMCRKRPPPSNIFEMELVQPGREKSKWLEVKPQTGSRPPED